MTSDALFAPSQNSKSILIRDKPAKQEYIIKERSRNSSWWEFLSSQPEIHDKSFSQVSDERIKAAKQLGSLFEALPDRNQAFEDLLRLCSDKNAEVREEAINSITTVFPNVPEKELVWERFVNLTAYPVEQIMRAAVNSLVTVFPLMQDKNGAWKDLVELINSKSSLEDVSRGIIHSLTNVISDFPDKPQAWKDLLEMTLSDDPYVREKATSSLSIVFPGLPEEKKSEAWEDLLELAGEAEGAKVREEAAKALGEVFPYLSDKGKAYSDLVNLVEKEDNYILSGVLKTHSSIHPQFYEKPGDIKARGQAEYAAKVVIEEIEERLMGEREVNWEDKTENEQVKETGRKKSAFDLLRLTGDRDGYVRKNAVESLARIYPMIPDKGEVIEELLRLSSDPDPQMRRGAIESLLAVYSGKAGKAQEIWQELLKMSEDADAGVRKGTAEMLSHVLPAIEEKSTVFYDLVRLTESQDAQLKKKSAELLAVAFKYSDDKQKAWDKLLTLTSSEDREVRKGAVLALSSGYSEVPDKSKVWTDLTRLSVHSDNFVQKVATKTLGPAFSYVPDKTAAWRDLQVLTDNPYIYTRKYAFRSLGRASLWKALKAENGATYLFGLKEAVKYFKEAAETSKGTFIPEFYYPFYEALLQVLFGGRSSKLESERYISEATHEIRDPEENKRLFEVLEELAELLREAGDITAGDLSARKKILEASIEAFDRASGLFETVEEDSILTQKTLNREYQKTGKVIMEQRLKEILSGIRYKAKTACLKSKGKPAERITCTVSQKVREWSFQDIEKDRKKLDSQLEPLLSIIAAQIPYISENTYIFEKLEEIKKEQDLLERYRLVGKLISLIPEVRMSSRASDR